MTPVTAEIFLVIDFTLSAGGSTWNLGAISGPEGPALIQHEAACL